MLEMGTSGLMSGEGKRVGSSRFRYRALPRLYGGETEKPNVSNHLAGLACSPPAAQRARRTVK